MDWLGTPIRNQTINAMIEEIMEETIIKKIMAKFHCSNLYAKELLFKAMENNELLMGIVLDEIDEYLIEDGYYMDNRHAAQLRREDEIYYSGGL